MYYLFVDVATICKWCREPIMQVVENDPNKIVVKLCPVCDRWPPDFLNKEQR